MIIDKNGIIDVPNLGLRLGPEFTLDELKRNPHFADFLFRGSNGDYVRYAISNALIDNLPFFINLYFCKNKISQIGICYSIYHYVPGKDWKKQKEQVDFIKKKHDEWMMEQHGATAKKYPWGLVLSGLDDSHGYDASIFIIYNRPENENLYKNFDRIHK